MAKKKATPKTTITPSTKDISVGVKFDVLEAGDKFIMNDRLWEKVDDDMADQAAVDMLNGMAEDELCDVYVVPVTTTITWKIK